jgi:hypothetical protein
VGVPIFGILGLSIGSPGTNDIWMLASWLDTENIIRGEGGGVPKVRAMVNFVSLCLPMVRACTKGVPTTH